MRGHARGSIKSVLQVPGTAAASDQTTPCHLHGKALTVLPFSASVSPVLLTLSFELQPIVTVSAENCFIVAYRYLHNLGSGTCTGFICFTKRFECQELPGPARCLPLLPGVRQHNGLPRACPAHAARMPRAVPATTVPAVRSACMQYVCIYLSNPDLQDGFICLSGSVQPGTGDLITPPSANSQLWPVPKLPCISPHLKTRPKVRSQGALPLQ